MHEEKYKTSNTMSNARLMMAMAKKMAETTPDKTADDIYNEMSIATDEAYAEDLNKSRETDRALHPYTYREVLGHVHDLFAMSGDGLALDDLVSRGAAVLGKWGCEEDPGTSETLLLALAKADGNRKNPYRWLFSDASSDEYFLAVYKGIQVLLVQHHGELYGLDICWMDAEDMVHIADIYGYRAVSWPFSQPLVGLQDGTHVSLIDGGDEYDFYGDSAYSFHIGSLGRLHPDVLAEITENHKSEILLYPKEMGEYSVSDLEKYAIRLAETARAQEYLRNNPRLRAVIDGQKRTLFYNNETDVFGIMAPGRRNMGYVFTDWDNVTRYIYPSAVSKEDCTKKIIRKMKKLAAAASFTNGYIRQVLAADEDKGLYEQGLTTGTRIDGKVITMQSIERHNPSAVAEFRRAFKERKDYQSGRFDYNGYDGSLSLWWNDGEPRACFNKEYRNCGNGYYYLLINDNTFIGYDID